MSYVAVKIINMLIIGIIVAIIFAKLNKTGGELWI